MTSSGLAHGIHHDQHYEYTWSLEERIEVIKRDKPVNEIPTRLAMIGIVPIERLPDSEALGDARKKADAAWQEYYAAREKYDAAEKVYTDDIEGLEYADAWKVYATARHKAALVMPKVDAAYQKVDAAWQKANDAWKKYDATHPSEVKALHDSLWPNCTWDGQRFVYPKAGE